MNFEQPRNPEEGKSPEELQEIGETVIKRIEYFKGEADRLNKELQEEGLSEEVKQQKEILLGNILSHIELLEDCLSESPSSQEGAAEAAEA